MLTEQQLRFGGFVDEGSAVEVYEWLDDAGSRLGLRPLNSCRR